MSASPAPPQACPARTVRTSRSAAQTDAIGAALARGLGAGDLVTLRGPLGAGKSHLARAMVRTVLGAPGAEVPSPTYTLVNVYEDGRVPVWHADLYRLGDVDELAEIGLEDALGDAMVIVEWPERWPDLPARRLDISLSVLSEQSRRLTLTPLGPGWDPLLRALGTLP